MRGENFLMPAQLSGAEHWGEREGASWPALKLTHCPHVDL